MKLFGALAVLGIMATTLVGASELPEASAVKNNDLVVATKGGAARKIPGYVVRNTYQSVTLQKSKTDTANPLTIPAGAVLYVFYDEANNEEYIAGLQAFEEKKYEEAVESLLKAGEALGDFTVASRKDEFLQCVNYYTGMCKYRMGDFPSAVEAFDRALKNQDAIFKLQAEYYLARCFEGMGDYEKAENKYGQLVNSVYPKLLQQAKWGAKWEFFAKLGQQRARLLLNAQREGQEANVQRALAAVDALLKEAGDKLDDEMKLDALMMRAGAEKYLAGKDASKYDSVLKLLDKPVREAVVRNDRAALAWMYCDVADSYYGLMEAEADPAKKKDLAEKARFEYMRVWMTTTASPANLCRAYFRTGKLCEQLKDKDWQMRALQAYRYASGRKFKDLPMSEEAAKLAKALDDAMVAEAKAEEAKAAPAATAKPAAGK